MPRLSGAMRVDHVGPAQMLERPVDRGDRRLRSRSPCPRRSRATPQPTSVPGQPSGIHGPSRPIQRPLDFSITENIAKPWIAHAPAIASKLAPGHRTRCGAADEARRLLVGHERGPGFEILGRGRAQDQAFGFDADVGRWRGMTRADAAVAAPLLARLRPDLDRRILVRLRAVCPDRDCARPSRRASACEAQIVRMRSNGSSRPSPVGRTPSRSPRRSLRVA